MGNCSSGDAQVVPATQSPRGKEVVIREDDIAHRKDSVKGILLRDGPRRTLSRVSWRDVGELAGKALPGGVDEDESVNLATRLAALGAPDPAEVANALTLLKGSSAFGSGQSATGLTGSVSGSGGSGASRGKMAAAAAAAVATGAAGGAAAGAAAVPGESTARVAATVLATLSVGATAISQRAAALKMELQSVEPSSLDADRAMNLAGKLEALAASAVEAGRHRDALLLCLHSHTLQADVLGPDSPEAAHCLVRVAHVLQMMGRLPQAELLSKHAAQQTAKGYGLEHRAPAEALLLCGEVLGMQGRFEEARSHLSCALELYVAAVGRQSAETANIYMRLGDIHRQRLLYDEAARLFRQAYNTRKRVLGPREPETAAALEALSGVMADNKQYLQAEHLYNQLLQMHQEMAGGGGTGGGGAGAAAVASHGVVVALSKLAAVQAADGREWEAEATYKRALAAATKLYGADHPTTQGVNLDLARLLIRRKDGTEVHLRAAEQLLRTTLRPAAAAPVKGGGRGALGGPAGYKSAGTGGGGAAGMGMGAAKLPSPMLHGGRSAGPASATGVDDAPANVTADAQVLLAELVTRKGRHEEAERLLNQALDAYVRQYGSEHPVTIRCMCSLAAAMAQRGRTSLGEPIARRALASATALLGEAHPTVAACLQALGDNLLAKGDNFEAHSVLRSAYRLLMTLHGPEDEETLRVKAQVDKLEQEIGWTQT